MSWVGEGNRCSKTNLSGYQEASRRLNSRDDCISNSDGAGPPGGDAAQTRRPDTPLAFCDLLEDEVGEVRELLHLLAVVLRRVLHQHRRWKGARVGIRNQVSEIGILCGRKMGRLVRDNFLQCPGMCRFPHKNDCSFLETVGLISERSRLCVAKLRGAPRATYRR